ncbi:MAG: alpha/beta hydrolase fold domain-containing protein [Mycobacterium sp.]|nr:alpha/beta hydrolase fold domain-containing protein [Mycobacterium sp.]
MISRIHSQGQLQAWPFECRTKVASAQISKVGINRIAGDDISTRLSTGCTITCARHPLRRVRKQHAESRSLLEISCGISFSALRSNTESVASPYLMGITNGLARENRSLYSGRYSMGLTKGTFMTGEQAFELSKFFAELGKRTSKPHFELETIRDVAENIHLATKEPEGVTYAEVDAGGVDALWCIPVGSDPDAVLLHTHMGGSVLMSMHSDRKAAAHIAKAAGMPSLVLNFRRSPEHKYPAQVDDVDSAYHWLLDQGYRAGKIASVGHSIGGYLAVELALRLRDRGEATPGAVLSISPWTDVTLSGKSIETNAERDKLLTRGLLELFRSCWLDGTGVEFTDPRVHLLGADLSALPPTAVYYGEYELLASDAIAFAQKAKEAGNNIVIRQVDKEQHSFIMGAGHVDEVDRTIVEMGGWLRSTLGLKTLVA